MHKWKKAWRLPWRQKMRLAEAWVLSGWYRFCVLQRSFGAIARHIGKQGMETAVEPLEQVAIGQVAWAVNVCARHTWWQCNCFVQALTARKMLVRRKLPCTLYMGARRSEAGQAQAHAWLRCGTCFVTGGDGSREYAVTSCYGTMEKNA